MLVVMPAQWPRALLRASLREIGYDAVGAHDVVDAIRRTQGDAPPVRLLIADQLALGRDEDSLPSELLAHLGSSDHTPLRLLIAPAAGPPAAGTWDVIVRRPVSIGEVVAAAESLLPVAADARRPVDPR